MRAVLGHWLFGYVHPYPDGNGRIARFMMNAVLASGGWHWTEIAPFAQFIAERVRRSTEQAA